MTSLIGWFWASTKRQVIRYDTEIQERIRRESMLMSGLCRRPWGLAAEGERYS